MSPQNKHKKYKINKEQIYFEIIWSKKVKKVIIIIIIMTSLIYVMSTILAFFLPITLFTELCDSKGIFENHTAFRH